MGTFDTSTPKRLQLASWEQRDRTAAVEAAGDKTAAPALYSPIAPPSPIYTHVGHAAQYGRGRRNGRTVRLLILHVTDVNGTLLGAMSFEARRPDQVSCTAFAGPLGELGATVPYADRPFTTGRWNDESLTLEIIGHDEWTAAQWRARPAQMEAIVVWLVDSCREFGIPPRWLDRGAIAKGASRHGQSPVQGTEYGICDHLEANLAARDLGQTSGTGHVCVGPGLRTVLFEDLLPEVVRRLTTTTPPSEDLDMAGIKHDRLVDTREGLGGVRLKAREQRTVNIPSTVPRPAGARTAVVKFEVVNPKSPDGFISADATAPGTATNVLPYKAVSGLAFVPVVPLEGQLATARFEILAWEETDLIIEIQGWAA
jgi:hypothetical protein